MSTVFLGIGSNIGHREAQIRRALERLGKSVRVDYVSSLYETEPMGYADQPWFLNAVCSGETLLDPFELLAFVKGIERRMGRTPAFPNGPRVIDIDILFYDDRIIAAEGLEIPHPRISERRFVLAPLVEIAPSLVDPVSGKTASELLSELPDSAIARKWGDVPGFRPAAL